MPALITGCAQNCAAALDGVLANIEGLRSQLGEYSEVLLLENDSSDTTRAQLRDYARASRGVHAVGFDQLNRDIPQKTIRLAHLRNTALRWLEAQGGVATFDLLVVLDLDEVNQTPWDLTRVMSSLAWWRVRDDAAGLFANQRGPYYDLWALRHPELCPGDIWAEVLNLHAQQPQLSDSELVDYVYSQHHVELLETDQPLAVDSAFGGLAFYRTSWLKRAHGHYCGETPLLWHGPQGPRWLRWQCCEHVALHQQLRSLGATLWIDPQLINWDTASAQSAGMRPNPSAWRSLIC